ncbi:DegT/DnrJ/EryC1/StrS family aminotransferase [Actinotalea ferrariae]|uniref:DegT/DnrJ/EryC1/StrS family aminotransferase n=1 Tax=Actinotalea ferrariae TaxID=1386098 RepID=UPI001C8BE542|nr:DegT/DnrJ/EryC1/StrS family aminotransferase [Actinotalea ferrariae]MBX9243462.1 DegT/DnrJ/EryC1/StrS family aminotransferase [Actinotalea ferrariae]
MDWIPVNDLSRALSGQADAIQEVVARVVGSGWLVQGPEHRAFQDELAAFLGVDHALGVASGTDALELALRATAPADRPVVLTAANCGGYTTTAARRAGLRVRYADVDPESLLLTAATVEAALDDTVGVVVVTHLYGRTADVAPVVELCHARGIRVVEDCAQSLGATLPAGRAGSFGDAATFSFYPTKNLGALGDGGAVATRSDEVATVVQELRQYGWTSKYTITRDGGRNSRLDELQAALLRHRLPQLEGWNARRREIIGHYADHAPASVRVLPAPDESHAGHLAVVVVEDRARLQEHLAGLGVRTDVHYPVPDHRQPAVADEYRGLTLPVTEQAADRVLSLPVFPELTDLEVERVGRALASF